MSGTGETYKPKERRKKAPVKRVTVSTETKAQYEKVLRERDERERSYGQHLHEDNKGKR